PPAPQPCAIVHALASSDAGSRWCARGGRSAPPLRCLRSARRTRGGSRGPPRINSCVRATYADAMADPDFAAFPLVLQGHGVEDVEFLRPVYPGDTVTARSVVVAKRESESRPAFGVVTWETEGRNQRGEVVISYRRTNLVAKRRT